MIWPLKKKPAQGPAGNAADDSWTLATSEDDGQPIIFRIRSQAPGGVKPVEYPWLLAICWEFAPGNASGMPSPEVADAMASFEELLTVALEPPGVAFNTAVVTGPGRREWQWYTRDRTEAMEAINGALQGELLPIKFSAESDADWDGYHQLRQLIQ